MKILFVHNSYYKYSGEEHSANELARVLMDRGHRVEWYRRNSIEADHMRFGNLRAGISGIYSLRSSKDVAEVVERFSPQVAQVQNLYPFISPSVLRVLKRRRVPVVMRCPNYRLFCPNGLFLDPSGNICEMCASSNHEGWCIYKNCGGSYLKSAAYALRNAVARVTRSIVENVDAFIVQSEFQRAKFAEYGVPIEKVHIIPGIASEEPVRAASLVGETVCYVGRVSPEKGVGDFIEAARRLPSLKFVLVGSVTEGFELGSIPENLTVSGFLHGEDLDREIDRARVLVVPSRCYEGFPNVIVKGMKHSKPIIVSKLGGLGEIVRDGANGFTFSPGSISDLVRKIEWLHKDPDLCRQIGARGREMAERLYGADGIYERLMGVYEAAMASGRC